ncbi:MAG: tol-pal system protein YbgF, partial [Gemmobacter sp.]
QPPAPTPAPQRAHRTDLTAQRSELLATPQIARPGGATILERMEQIELELMRVTARAEELELRIERIVADGTNRLGDLEFRIVELEGGDVSQLGQTPPLGGGATPGGAAPTAPAAGPQMAEGEQAAFDRAREVLGQGDFRTAVTLLEAHAETWPAGPLTGEAHFLRGEALAALGETSQAARAWLESFSGYPDGPRAGDALVRLGIALHDLGQRYESCVTLAEVGPRYPGTPAAAEAAAAMLAQACP